MQSKRDWRKRRRIRGRRRKRNGGPGGREKGRRGGWCGRIGRSQCKLLSAVRNLRMRSWSVENFPFIVFWFNYFREHYMDRVWRRQVGWEEDWSFYFFIFFCKYISLLFFFTVFYHHHFQMQGFIFMSFILISLFNTRFHSHLVSFHFFLFNKKKKRIKYYAISHLTFCCVYGYQT